MTTHRKRLYTIGETRNALDPVNTRSAAFREAGERAYAWQTALARYGVTIAVVDVQVMRQGALADQYRVKCANIAPSSANYPSLATEIKRTTKGQVVRAEITANNAVGSEFDLYHSQPYKTFSWKRVPLDALYGLFLIVCALLIPITALYMLPWMPFSQQVQFWVDQTHMWMLAMVCGGAVNTVAWTGDWVYAQLCK